MHIWLDRPRPGARDFSKTPAAVALWFSCEWFGKALAEHRADLAAGVLETSFLPGRSFSGPADFNTQLAEWLERVNQRPRRALGCAPCDRIVAERQQMLTLPPVPPATGWRIWLRLPRDHYVRLDGNDYSVHPSVIGRRIEVVADLDRVRAFCDGRLVADHARVWARHQSLSDPDHVAAAKRLRLASGPPRWSAR